ncbi:hypothetical protein [Halococcus saccharolyticus]|uniref:Membrane-bound metal-dependent hydrolase n=1 Tax=Halococcus saccharolyticus DSM 5350 TaxID=1227455 RepID=M0MMX1_9EURY|nr:hypothetical protein [Halococcus saccharolyticus]EMA45805.1 hypothetical protein C449_06066 [Halococcus saccharolyticus DSM 5350]
MKSGEHFLLSLPVAGAVLAAVGDRCSSGQRAALAGYGLSLGVLIDLDHFLLARLRVGDWRHVRNCLRDPKRVFFDQKNLFEGTGGMANLRLLSHVFIAGPLTVLTGLIDRRLGIMTGAVLYVHVLADLLRDNEIV